MKRLLVTLVACTVLFSSCGLLENTQNVEELLAPPKITQMQAEIVRAIEEKEGGNIQLKAPVNGDNIFSVYMGDIDGDGIQEAIVFYVMPQKSSNVRFAILVQTESGFAVVAEEEGVSFEIERFTVASFYTGVDRQLVVGYQSPNWNEYYMVVYNCVDEEGNISITRAHEQAYSNFLVCDMTNDGREDLLITTAPRANTSNGILLNLFSAVENNLEQAASYELNNRLRRCDSMYQSIGPQRENVVVMDCSRGVTATASMSSSVAIYYSDGALEEYHLLGEEDFITSTTRTAGILQSIDLDEDGSVEVPVVIGAYTGAPTEMRFLAVDWYDLFVSVDEPDCFGIVDIEYGFFIKLPAALRETTMVQYSEESGNFVLADIETEEIIFEVALLAKGESFTEDEERDYTQMALSGGYRVYIRIANLPEGVDAGTLLSGFVILR